nr:RDD family protein [Litorihabitans aurantiacus]
MGLLRGLVPGSWRTVGRGRDGAVTLVCPSGYAGRSDAGCASRPARNAAAAPVVVHRRRLRPRRLRSWGEQGARDLGQHPVDGESHLGRRLLALVVDWALASAISAGFFSYDALATLGVFAAMTLLLVVTVGATIGHRLLGLRVYRIVDGGTPPRPLQALVRTLLMCLVLPAAVSGSDGRGLHDIAAGTRIDRWRAA